MVVQLRDEIRKLRLGRGVNTPDLTGRLGTHLRVLCGVQEGPELRSILVQEVLACAGGLPDDVQDILAVSLGIDTEVWDLARFTDRVDHLAERLAVSSRTALRRIGHAEARLAAEIALVLSREACGGRVITSYYIGEYRTIVDNTGVHSDRPVVVVHQEREIVSVENGLSRIPIRLELPDHPDTPAPVFSVRAQHGGGITSLRRTSPTGFEFVLELPSPLTLRQSHRFGLSFTMPAGLVRPHHVITGQVAIRRHLLILKFHPDRPPVWIRRVDGEDIRTLDAFARRTTAPQGGFRLDAVGEAHLEFEHLRPHLAYGCQFRWSDSPGEQR